ncbi:MAG: UbiA family prenyltransferase [Thaumarchaeota archaeon]|nr:UbiA family prenyltransferase [Nitrososphaerota archaeon]MCL5316724.1 UbiA family prenyltransferase [Nitrososphaerota archaeon]
MRRVRAWLLIVRSEARTIIFAWSLTVSVIVASEFRVGLLRLVTVSLGYLLLSLSIYIFSAMMDVNEDRINSPSRPLASGAASHEDAAILVCLMGATALFTAFSISLATVAFFIIAFLLGISYSTPPIRAKEHFPHKVVVPVTGAIICSLTGGVIIGQISAAVVLASIAFAIFSLVTLFLGDVADLKGDLSAGVRSLSILIGSENTVKITLTLPLLIDALGLLFYQAANLNMLFPLMLTAASGYSSLTITKLIGKSEDVKRCRAVKSKMRVMHLVMQLSFIIGVVRLP